MANSSPKAPANPPQDLGGALAALVGHELNNIAVPLDGFAELALQSLGPGEAARQSLDEMRMAIGRIQALAAELESLGETQSTPTWVAIGDCMRAAQGGAPVLWKIDWRCNPDTTLKVDRWHAQHAIASLARIATPAGATSAPAQLSVSQEPRPTTHCAVCRAVLARRRATVWVEAHSARSFSTDTLRDPLGSTRGRVGRRLTLAVLVHAAHHAGGHLLLDETTGLLSVAFSAR